MDPSTRLSGILMIRRDLLEIDPGPDVYCVIESSKKREGGVPTRRRSLYKIKRGVSNRSGV